MRSLPLMEKPTPVFRARKRNARRSAWGTPWIRWLSFLPGPWLLVDRGQKKIVDGSPQLDELLSCNREHYIGHPLAAIASQEDGSGWGTKRLDGETIELPGRYEDVGLKRADGTSVVVDVHVSHPPLRGRLSTAICLITDRTEQRRLQGELIAKHQELRRAFQDLENSNRELGVISAKLSRATELAAIGEITAELTHQLNNPLAAAVGAARRVEKLIGKNSQPQTQAMIELLKNSLERLRCTVAELRRVYITSRPIEGPIEEFELKPQVDSAIALLHQRLENTVLEIELPNTLPLVLGRPSQIQHVLINLLDNAAEAAGTAGTVCVRAERNDETVVFTLGDSGPGVPEHLREKIFEPFFTTREHGSGLGLAVVRRNLNHDGATIRVGESQYGGAEFEIGFPIAESQEEEQI